MSPTSHASLLCELDKANSLLESLGGLSTLRGRIAAWDPGAGIEDPIASVLLSAC